MSAVEQIFARRSILICCGAGGVGKTTTSAALGLAGAMSGKRVCVVTIDPSKRLADALDIDPASNSAHRIEGSYSGELYALVLDAKATFDQLINQNAKNPEQAERIKTNRLYRNLVSALSGTQEYMATEKLYELHESGNFDLIIVDTPPTRYALEFLSAPSRLAGFLDNKIFRLLVTPGRAYMKAFSFATQMLLKTIAKIAGSEIVEDTIAFFQAFDGMEQGFKDRASSVNLLLREGQTGFVLVAAPRPDAIEQAQYFAERLKETSQQIDALVVNRLLPDFDGPEPMPTLSDKLGPLNELVRNLEELVGESRREHALLASLRQAVDPAPALLVPLLDADVHDLAGLEVVVRHLLKSEVP